MRSYTCRGYLALWRRVVINPGSPTYPHNLSTQLGTVGVLTLAQDRDASIAIYDLKTLEPLTGLARKL